MWFAEQQRGIEHYPRDSAYMRVLVNNAHPERLQPDIRAMQQHHIDRQIQLQRVKTTR